MADLFDDHVVHLVLADREGELPARRRREHRGPVVLHDLDVVDGDPDPSEELAPVECHPVFLFVADLEREIYVQTHRRILPAAGRPPRDPDGLVRWLLGYVLSQLTPGLDRARAHNLRGHRVGVFEGKHVATARQGDEAGTRDGAHHLIGPGG